MGTSVSCSGPICLTPMFQFDETFGTLDHFTVYIFNLLELKNEVVKIFTTNATTPGVYSSTMTVTVIQRLQVGVRAWS